MGAVDGTFCRSPIGTEIACVMLRKEVAWAQRGSPGSESSAIASTCM